jgi:hypothetical protein
VIEEFLIDDYLSAVQRGFAIIYNKWVSTDHQPQKGGDNRDRSTSECITWVLVQLLNKRHHTYSQNFRMYTKNAFWNP